MSILNLKDLLPQMATITKSFETLLSGKIDRASGVISGVAAITIGQAKGHNVWIDGKTLETVKQVASEFEKGIKVKFRHGKAGDFQSVIDETCGLLKNFQIEGDKVRGDLHLLKSLSAEQREKIFEMAELMPEQFGLSIVFSGVNESIKGKDFLRCHELQSIDLTDKPAANPDGLFSMKSIKYESGESGKHAKDCMCGECGSKSMEELSTLVTGLAASVKELTDKMATANVATSLAFKDKEGKVVQLSAADLVTRLDQSAQFVADATKKLEASERSAVINRIQNESRVVLKDDGIAYKLEELEKLDIAFLKFAAKNSPIIPTQAKLTYSGTGNPPKEIPKGADGKPLTGDALMTASLEAAGYDDIDKMIARATSKNMQS